MKVKKGDNVIILAGKEKGKQGKIIQVLPALGKVVVEGLQIRKRHARPRKEGEKGQILAIPSPLSASNCMLVCAKCNQPTRLGSRITPPNVKTRVCKKCGEIV